MVRVLIADDHEVVRRGVRQILQEYLPDVNLGEATSGEAALEQVQNHEWDLVILDLGLPGKSGLEVLKQLREAYPRLPVLVLSMYPEVQYAVRVLRAGAAGYVTKETASEDLLKAVLKVLHGGKYVSALLAEKLALDLELHTQGPPHEALSDREYEVMLKIAAGSSVKEIAYQLGLSAKTVSTYRERILLKMKMKTNADLTYYAIRNNLIDWNQEKPRPS
jgi:DNA-binding NarL/FixJ family response regulator